MQQAYDVYEKATFAALSGNVEKVCDTFLSEEWCHDGLNLSGSASLPDLV